MKIKITAKCSDQCIIECSGKDVEHCGYVPDWFPGNHNGDYIILNIDTDTGQILNWNKPTKKQLKETFEE